MALPVNVPNPVKAPKDRRLCAYGKWQLACDIYDEVSGGTIDGRARAGSITGFLAAGTHAPRGS